MPPPGLLGLITRGAGALGQRLAQGGAAPAAPAAAPAVDPLQRASTNALVNPNMPIEAGFQTPSAKVNADLERQARIRNQLSAGRAAIIERARAQGRQVDVDPNTGQLIIGDVQASSPVRTIGGQRFAFDAQGRPVGMAADTGVAPPRMEGQTTPSVLTPEMADMNRQRIAAALSEALRRSAAPVAAAAPAMAAPIVAAPAPTMTAPAAPALPLPTAPARPTPMPSAPFRDATGRVDTAAVARAQGRTPVEVQPTPEQALAQAEQFIEQEPERIMEEDIQRRTKSYQEEVAETTRQLTRARMDRNIAAVRRLTNKLSGLLSRRPAGREEAARVEEERQIAAPFIPLGG